MKRQTLLKSSGSTSVLKHRKSLTLLFCFLSRIPCSFQHITLHLVSSGACRPCLSFLALKSHFRNCLLRPKITTNAWVSFPSEGNHMEQPSVWHPGSITSLINLRRLWAATAPLVKSLRPSMKLCGTSQQSLQPQPPLPLQLQLCWELALRACNSPCSGVWTPHGHVSLEDVIVIRVVTPSLTFCKSGLEFPKALNQLPLFLQHTARVFYIAVTNSLWITIPPRSGTDPFFTFSSEEPLQQEKKYR